MPFSKYKDFKDCVSKNGDKDDPEGYCATIMRKVEERQMEDEHKMISRTRTLEVSIPTENYVRMKDGRLLVRNIKVLAEGTWTDSAVGTPLHYPAKTLERDAANWVGKGIWSRHQGGSPRPITDRIGMIKNPRYDPQEKAIMADGLFHGRSQASKDVIQMIEDGEDPVTDVSAEVGGKEVWNAETKRYEAASLSFYGLATVDRGACTACKMKRNEATECETREQEERKQMETKELEEKLAALETEKVELTKKAGTDMAELTKQLETVSKARGDEDVAHKEAVKAFEAKIADYETRIKELEKTAKRPTSLPGTGADTQLMQLEVLTPATIRNGDVTRS